MKTDITTIKEVAAYLRLTGRTDHRFAAHGKIPGFEIGGKWRLRRGHMEKRIDEAMNRKAHG